MLFSSTIFVFGYLFGVLLIYYGLLRTNKSRNVFLFLASIFFYAWGEPRFVFLLLLSIAANWLFGLLIARFADDKKKNRLVVFLMVLFNLSLITVFKYLGFITTNLNKAFNLNLAVPKIALPIGISFFTFQAISYCIDVLRGNGTAQKNPVNVGLYISFFPQLIAGPIVRYETVADQIKNRKESFGEFSKGVVRFIEGFGKKVLISNQMAIIADAAFDGGVNSLSFAWLGAICYMLQIYFDFGGYSDMAIGLGHMFGFSFDENFNYPYIASSITDFWHRWHISLSTWFRDYVYIPLGGSRVEKKSRYIFNLFAVWFLTGLWHGASWNFIVWGLYYFVFLIIEKIILKYRPEQYSGFSLAKKIFMHIYALLTVLIGWVFFRAETLSAAAGYLSKMFSLSLPVLETDFMQFISKKWYFILFGIIFSMPLGRYAKEFMSRLDSQKNGALKLFGEGAFSLCLMLIFFLSVAFLLKEAYNPFIYFNF